MAWEARSGQTYYYRKRRVGRRVVSEYVGTGPLAEAVAAGVDYDRAERVRATLHKQVQQHDEVGALLSELEGITRTLGRAVLLANGYHRHKGTWRRRRGRD